MKINQIVRLCSEHPINQILRFLDKAPKDEVYTTNELIEGVNITPRMLNSVVASQKHLIEKYQYMPIHRGHGRFWGNPAAIKTLKNKFGV